MDIPIINTLIPISMNVISTELKSYRLENADYSGVQRVKKYKSVYCREICRWP